MLINASIDLTKVDENRIIEGKKGKYINLTIWVSDTVDQYGNDVSVQQKTDKDEDKIYLGNGRVYKSRTMPSQPQNDLSSDLPY